MPPSDRNDFHTQKLALALHTQSNSSSDELRNLLFVVCHPPPPFASAWHQVAALHSVFFPVYLLVALHAVLLHFANHVVNLTHVGFHWILFFFASTLFMIPSHHLLHLCPRTSLKGLAVVAVAVDQSQIICPTHNTHDLDRCMGWFVRTVEYQQCKVLATTTSRQQRPVCEQSDDELESLFSSQHDVSHLHIAARRSTTVIACRVYISEQTLWVAKCALGKLKLKLRCFSAASALS